MRNSIFSIKEIILFLKNSNNFEKLPLIEVEENQRSFIKFQGDHKYEALEKIYFILKIDSEGITANMKEEMFIKLEFYNGEDLTCYLENSVELNFERIFEIKFNHYSNALFSFSNIQLKNLSFYSFSMLSFFLDSNFINFVFTKKYK